MGANTEATLVELAAFGARLPVTNMTFARYERVAFCHGESVEIDAGSGRSWGQTPRADPTDGAGRPHRW
ncbi:MAG: hypothetical protein H0T89_24460 [Deltaproteobacteria bacterium]|nr:hypothetical protein [Deltaproteobacteria bacterium]MDQ3369468.1 hypothetical protein [Myxococcota bacterium]